MNVAPIRETTLRDYKQRLLRVLVLIQERLDGPLDLEALAARACLSPYHFHRVFTGLVGETLMAHIRRLRLERAAGRLKLGRRPVIEIAVEAGYETHEAFSRAFKASFGRSPSAFRARSSAPANLPAQSGIHYREPRALRDFKAIRPSNLAMKVTIQRLAPIRAAFMRHVGPYAQVGATWDKFCMFLGKEGLLGGDSRFIGVCHDDPEVTPPDKIRYDACVSVSTDFQPAGEVGVQVIAGGAYAVLTHHGPYAKLGESYQRLVGQWLPRSGHEMAASPCFEEYLLLQTFPGDFLLAGVHLGRTVGADQITGGPAKWAVLPPVRGIEPRSCPQIKLSRGRLGAFSSRPRRRQHKNAHLAELPAPACRLAPMFFHTENPEEPNISTRRKTPSRRI